MRKIEEISSEERSSSSMSKDKSVYYEELRVARDAISNLRNSFSDSDPNQYILDTLEQCISVIVERMVEGGSKPGSRMSNSEISDPGEQSSIINHQSSIINIFKTIFHCQEPLVSAPRLSTSPRGQSHLS